MTRLGDVCEKIGSGATPRGGKEAYKDAGIPIIRSQNIHDWVFQPDGLAFLDDEQAESLSNVEVRSNDVLLNITGDSVARACIVPSERIPARVNQHVAIVRAGKEINPTYLLASLQSKKTTLLSLASSGATRNALTKRMIENLDIDLPSREIQDSIAQVLDSIQYKITLNNRLNDYLADFASTVFQNQASHIEERIALFDIADIKYGKGLAKNELVEDGYPVFGGNGQIGFYSKYLYEEPQILISCRGAASGKVLVSLPKSFITSNSLIIELKDRRYYEYLKQYFMLHQLYDYATGSAQPQITIDGLRHLTVPYPPFDLIKTLTNQLKAISDCIYSNDIENQALSRLRDTLLPKLMSGEIDVSKVDLTQLTNNHLADC
ncbi:restriction endonuclease subunit S [Bifidobacterium bifidum]|uniref:restriction endonuclease subunit S n=1 Tax=Bifidobacterium bifidum TaxID=1681 RepID=UPI0022E2C275|nr:restriction endonuclease subunit S [Bifidobacterium bifidum]